MNKQIKIELYQHDNYLYGRCLEFPDELRGCDEIIADSKSGFTINSVGFPSAYGDSLYLCGTYSVYDDSWFHLQCKTSEEATTIKTIIEGLIKDWNKEHREILDEVEKEYLIAVIKPFRKKVQYIAKRSIEPGLECIRIRYEDRFWGKMTIVLPTFHRGTMYKGMESGKEYTLEELGL